MKAVIYARTATADSETNIEDQVRRCQEYARAKGYAIVQVYRDLGQSGTKVERPGLNQMVEDVTLPGADIQRVLVTDLSRIARGVDVFAELSLKLQRCGVVIERLDGDARVEAAIVSQVQQAMADYERRALQERARAGRKGRG